MARIFLLRHGQTQGFLSDGYTHLTDVGVLQAKALGAVLGQRGLVPTAVVVGPQPRHQETWQHAAAASGQVWPAAVTQPAWDEHQGAAMLQAAVATGRISAESVAEAAQAFEDSSDRASVLRLFRAWMARWVAGELDPPEVESWPCFRARVGGALEAVVEAADPRGVVFVFTSGGAVGAATASVLRLPTEQAALSLGFEVANASITELTLRRGGLGLHSFNGTGHLGTEAPWTAI